MTKTEILLIKNGELALKGLNRSTFEDALMRNLRRRLNKIGKFEMRKAHPPSISNRQSRRRI